MLAGLPVADRSVLQLTRRLRENELDATAERLEGAYDPEAILHVLEACPGELIELRATLVQKHVCGSAKASRSLERGASRTLRTGIQNHRRNRSRRGKQ